MKIQCIVQNLKEAISNAERNTSKNQTLPILGSLMIKADNNGIKIYATNLETAIEINVSGKVIENGVVVVPAKTLGAFMTGVSSEHVVLQSQKNNLFIKTNYTETTVLGYNPEDFPIFPKTEPIAIYSLDPIELRSGISSVVVACSSSDLKPELNSVFFKIFKNTIRIVATDSFRLAERILTYKDLHSDKQISFLVPQKSIIEIIKILENSDDVEFGICKTQVVLKTKNIKFISRLVDGNFPDYEQIIPKSFKITAVSKKNDVLCNLKLSSAFLGKLNEIEFLLNPTKKHLFISTSNPALGEHSSITESSIQGDLLKLKFNWKYLLDGILQVNNDLVVFNLNNENSPMLLKGKGDGLYFYLVMPMKIS